MFCSAYEITGKEIELPFDLQQPSTREGSFFSALFHPTPAAVLVSLSLVCTLAHYSLFLTSNCDPGSDRVHHLGRLRHRDFSKNVCQRQRIG